MAVKDVEVWDITGISVMSSTRCEPTPHIPEENVVSEGHAQPESVASFIRLTECYVRQRWWNNEMERLSCPMGG